MRLLARAGQNSHHSARTPRKMGQGCQTLAPFPPLSTQTGLGERETTELDRELTKKIESLLAQRQQLRETTERVRNRPPLTGSTLEERKSETLPVLTVRHQRTTWTDLMEQRRERRRKRRVHRAMPPSRDHLHLPHHYKLGQAKA